MMIELAAPAKVNLNLHVAGRRPDGFHELVTRMQKLDLCDLVEIELDDSGTIEIVCDSKEVPTDASNLAVKAAVKFFDVYEAAGRYGLKIHLTKRIPVAAGLGGGSSDGAAVLKGLNQLFDFPFSEPELLLIGRSLGADFAFLISNSSAAMATGIGDRLHVMESADRYYYLLVNPAISVETTWVYDNYRLTKKSDKFIVCGSQISEKNDFAPGDLHNDLEQVTIPRYPIIDRIKKQLIEEGAAGALMTGSGPTVFGLFEDQRVAEIAFDSLTKQFTRQSGYKILQAKAYGGA